MGVKDFPAAGSRGGSSVLEGRGTAATGHSGCHGSEACTSCHRPRADFRSCGGLQQRTFIHEHTHTSAKYEKFVYSTGFGFSVPRSEWGLSQGAFDSMLALSERGDNLYRVRRQNIESEIIDNVLRSVWKPWANDEVHTWVVAGLPWHIRIHRVETGRSLDTAEGGFALGQENEMISKTDVAGAMASTAWGTSGIKDLLGCRKGELVWPNANTNLLHPRTVLPRLTTTLEPGIHWLASAVNGSPSEEA